MEMPVRHLRAVPSAEEVAQVDKRLARRRERRQTLSAARRSLVLDAAREVFMEAGIEGASVREIARRAGYTPGALYSYFESKEAIYAVLLEESLARLQASVDAVRAPRQRADQQLAARAGAWFGFYAKNPRDLDLGFYLFQGMAPRGLTGALNQRLNDQLHAALRPCEEAMQAMGLTPEAALRENTALFAHGVGLLVLLHTGRIRMFGQSAEQLFEAYVAQLVQRLRPPADGDDQTPAGQGDLFG